MFRLIALAAVLFLLPIESLGDDVNRRFDHGMTMLMQAAIDGDLQGTERLLAAGADPNLTAEKGYTALIFAIAQNHKDVARALLKGGANPNAQKGPVGARW